MRAILPDILTRFPVGSIVVWRRSMWGKIQYIPARVAGKTPRQGNQRIAIDVLYIASDGHGDKAIFVKRMGCVGAASIMTLAAWYNQSGRNQGYDRNQLRMGRTEFHVGGYECAG